MRFYAPCVFIVGWLLFVPGGPESQDAAAEAGPKQAQFDRLFAEWKEVIAQLWQLRMDYRQAPLDKQGDLDARYAELVAQGEKLRPALRAAAEAAYREAPDGSLFPPEYLMGVIYESCIRDAFEDAFSLARLLSEGGFERETLYGWAGLAAFGVNEFELAQKWLRRARENNVPAKYGPPWDGLCELALRSCPFYRKAWKREQALRDADAQANQSPKTWLPRVLLRTSKGDIELELFENEAPNTVKNFIWLVEQGAYNGMWFPRVIDHWGAEAGARIPRYTIRCECYQPNYRLNLRGCITMFLPDDGRDRGSSPFYLLFLPRHGLDGKNTCFGRIVKGMDVLSRLQRVTPKQFDEIQPDSILEAKVLRKRDHAYEPEKLPLPKP
jgi:cyclophilin family peptidyl-prolyl cis-trans isomerase